jgi:hypothetical protein
MNSTTHRYGWYLAALQLFFTLCWTVYALYLPQLAASAGIAAGSVILILILDQAVFTVCDFATGIAADKVTRVVGRLGVWVVAVTAVSCLAFLALPFVAHVGAPMLLAVTLVWTVSSSALRAPPMMLIGKYAAKPSIPYLSSLAMLGYGVAGALGPYLVVTLRNTDPRLPFALASLVLVLTAIGMLSAERRLASEPPSDATEGAKARPFGQFTPRAFAFTLAMIVLALGFQIHFSVGTRSLFLRFAEPADLSWLMPVFWIGFNVAMFPASLVTKRLGGYVVMGAAGLIGAAAIYATHAAGSLDFMIGAQLIAGAAWGAIMMSAFTVAFEIGANGGEGRMSGLLFSTLAIATLARMAAIATGLNTDPAVVDVLRAVPIFCWAIAGAALLYLGIATIRQWAAGPSRPA